MIQINPPGTNMEALTLVRKWSVCTQTARHKGIHPNRKKEEGGEV